MQLIGRNAAEGLFGVRITLVFHWNAHTRSVWNTRRRNPHLRWKWALKLGINLSN